MERRDVPSPTIAALIATEAAVVSAHVFALDLMP